MANKTDFLNLVLAANNEYNNTWDVVLNKNFTLIDQAMEEVTTEIQSARFSKTSLAEFLDVAHFDDGTLKPSDEMSDARNSSIYGDDDGAGADYLLKNRLELADKEIFASREGLASLQAALARRSSDFHYPDTVILGAKTGDGQPNFLSSSVASFLLNGATIPVELNIEGYYFRVRTLETIDVIAGGDGTRYLYAQKPATPIVVLDRSTDIAGLTITNPLNNNKVQILQDSGINFSTSDVKVGDILEILNTDNAGEYVISQIAPDGNDTQIMIVGRFVNVITAINYIIKDTLRPEILVDIAYEEIAGKCYIGEGEFTSGALTSSLSYNFKGKFSSIYEAIDLTTLPTFEKIFNHNLGVFPSSIQVFASQANDGSEALEPLSVSQVGNDIAIDVDDTLNFSAGTWDAGTTDANYNPLPSLAGGVAASITGNVFNLRSVSIKITKTQIYVKNTKINHFYRDYDGSDQSIGFLKVICKK